MPRFLLIVLITCLAVLPGYAQESPECPPDYEGGARIELPALPADTELQLVAMGLGGFDPQLTLAANGAVRACDDDNVGGMGYAVNLPTARSEPNVETAIINYALPTGLNNADFDIYVTGSGGEGEFLLMVNGLEIFPADEVDEIRLHTNTAQVQGEVPMTLYAVNLNRAEVAVDPTLRLVWETEFEERCDKSSSNALCEGVHWDLSDYSVVLRGDDILLSGDDAMLYYEVGGIATHFTILISSYQSNSFGPYSFLLHSGVGASR